MDLAKLKKEFEQGKLTRAEANKAVSNARALIRALIEYVQRSRAREIEQLKIRVKYGKKLGEVIILDDFAFIVLDIEKPEAGFKRAKIRESGLLTDVDDSSPEEFEKKLSQLKNPRKVFISGELFDSLRRIFGKEMEILLD